ncbi:DUF7347 domain-containing protein [Halosimplex halobium]|uniref:DUF7347 domain-containing protein n=1 Tax=Halosimplex halobium TaxID=3396618 RepID=UPI003F57508D
MASTAAGATTVETAEVTDSEAAEAPLPAPETLELATDETRRTILTTLWRAEGPLGFAVLRRRTGVDGSGRFNYHLQRLLGRCVRDAGEGYELTPRGERFVAALAAVPPVAEAGDRDPPAD